MENVAFELLGLADEYKNKPPTIGSYPPIYTREANGVWKELFQSPNFLANLHSYPFIGEQWKYAISELFQICRRRGIMVKDASRVTNNVIRHYLKIHRAKLVVFLDTLGLLQNIRLLNVQRSVTVHDNGFTLRVTADVALPRKSIFSHHTDILTWLESKAFVGTGKLQRRRVIGKGLSIQYEYGDGILPNLTYLIHCPYYPDLKTYEGNLVPLPEVESFILRMYSTIVRDTQFKTIRSKQIRF